MGLPRSLEGSRRAEGRTYRSVPDQEAGVNMPNDDQSNEEAVWWFVGATFVFISPTLFFRDMSGWFQLGTAVLGGVLLIVGFFKYRQERQRSREQSGDD